jgi:hypothetical protein
MPTQRKSWLKLPLALAIFAGPACDGGAKSTVDAAAPGGAGAGGATGGAGGATGGSGGGGGGGATGGMGGGGAGGAGGGVPAANTTVVLASMLTVPRDLAFNPRKRGELWVVNAADSFVTIIQDATVEGAVTAQRLRDRNYAHFMPRPSGIDFGADDTNPTAPNAAGTLGTFATCQESRNGATVNSGNDFMGPVLWPSDPAVFANPARYGLLGSHIDMLHQSPLCMGIAWQGTGNVYWTFNGLSKSIGKYDFQKDHGVGNDDHTDGLVWRYALGQVGYVQGVPSHLFYRAQDKMLYIADTGNARVVKLDTTTGTRSGPLRPPQDEAESSEMTGATLAEVVPAASGLLKKPSGLEVRGENIYVSDNETGIIHKFGLDGRPAGAVQTDVGAGGLAGMVFGPDGKLYFVDMSANRVLRLNGGL